MFFGRPTTFLSKHQVKSFVDRSADFQGFCDRWSVGRWSPDERPTVGRCFEEIYIMISAEGHPIIGCQSADDRQTVGRWGFIKESSADRRRYRPSFGRWSFVCRPIIKCDLCYIFFYNACILIMYEVKSCIKVILGFISLDLVYKEKKKEIWPSPMTKPPIPTENSKTKGQHTQTPQKLRLHNDCGPT